MSKAKGARGEAVPVEVFPAEDTLPSALEPSEPKAPKAEPEAPKRTPRYPVGDLAKKHGEIVKLKFPRRRIVPSALHAAAAALHGWLDHRHHAGEPMRLTDDEYKAALKAATRPPRGKNKLEPHRPALSEHCPHAFMKKIKES